MPWDSSLVSHCTVQRLSLEVDKGPCVHTYLGQGQGRELVVVQGLLVCDIVELLVVLGRVDWRVGNTGGWAGAGRGGGGPGGEKSTAAVNVTTKSSRFL